MREILFRGKEDDKSTWVYGFYDLEKDYRDNPPFKLKPVIVCAGKGIFSFVVHDTVGQYTGLDDKNGKKIFEGDIIEFDDEVFSSFETSCGTEYDSCEIKNRGVVVFDDSQGRFDFGKYQFNESQIEADLHQNHELEFSDFVQKQEVIGNIYDNPELLEVEE